MLVVALVVAWSSLAVAVNSAVSYCDVAGGDIVTGVSLARE